MDEGRRFQVVVFSSNRVPKPIDVEKVNWDSIAETLFPDGLERARNVGRDGVIH